MSRIASTFKNLSDREEKALIAYIMAGDPSLERTEEIVLALERSGADLIELGVPFSDPVADGPTIQRAAERALRGKASLPLILERVAHLRGRTEIPLILMSYLNPILRMGDRWFLEAAKVSGADGVIIPDLPIEEGEEFSVLAREKGIDLIFLAAPTSGPARLKRIARRSSGFLYYVSLTGITGARLQEVASIQKRIAAIKRITSLPVAVGFGVSTPEEAKALARTADGVIVGSAIVKIIEQYGQDPGLIPRLEEFTRSLKKGLSQVKKSARPI
jgi:tryptophan synthase alpha chain